MTLIGDCTTDCSAEWDECESARRGLPLPLVAGIDVNNGRTGFEFPFDSSDSDLLPRPLPLEVIEPTLSLFERDM